MSSPFSVICDVKAQRHRFVASPNRLRQRHRFRPVAERLLLVDRDVQRLDHDAERRRRGVRVSSHRRSPPRDAAPHRRVVRGLDGRA